MRNLLKGFDRLMMAITFAEAGEHDTAIEMMREDKGSKNVARRSNTVRGTVASNKKMLVKKNRMMPLPAPLLNSLPKWEREQVNPQLSYSWGRREPLWQTCPCLV